LEQPQGHTQERIGGIIKKMLTQTLRKLESSRPVERRALRSPPPCAEYRLTEFGRSLLEPVRSLSPHRPVIYLAAADLRCPGGRPAANPPAINESRRCPSTGTVFGSPAGGTE
jgi:hypothetical protein